MYSPLPVNGVLSVVPVLIFLALSISMIKKNSMKNANPDHPAVIPPAKMPKPPAEPKPSAAGIKSFKYGPHTS